MKKVNEKVGDICKKLQKSGTGYNTLEGILQGFPHCKDLECPCNKGVNTAEDVIEQLDKHGKRLTADKVRKLFKWKPRCKVRKEGMESSKDLIAASIGTDEELAAQKEAGQGDQK